MSIVELTEEEAVGALAEKVKEFNKVLDEAVDIAREYKLEFDIYPARGMGGTFEGNPKNWDLESWEDEDTYDGWQASSASC